MAREQEDLLLSELDPELASVLFEEDPTTTSTSPNTSNNAVSHQSNETPAPTNGDEYELVPGQLAVDVYETPEQLIIKARTAGVNRNDLDVSIAEGVLRISGTLSSGDDTEATHWYVQECYWGEFSRTLVLPVTVKEDEVKAVLKDGVLTITFNKVKQEQARKIQIQ